MTPCQWGWRLEVCELLKLQRSKSLNVRLCSEVGGRRCASLTYLPRFASMHLCIALCFSAMRCTFACCLFVFHLKCSSALQNTHLLELEMNTAHISALHSTTILEINFALYLTANISEPHTAHCTPILEIKTTLQCKPPFQSLLIGWDGCTGSAMLSNAPRKLLWIGTAIAMQCN